MKVILLVVGKTNYSFLKEGIDMYVERVNHFVPYEIVTIADIKKGSKLSEDMQKTLEGEQILSQIQTGDKMVLLDERGKEYTSREFATLIQREMLSSIKRLVFVVGGPYGFSKEVYARADGKISLSKMTFSHEMIRLFFSEQLYRAMTILKGMPYHHD